MFETSLTSNDLLFMLQGAWVTLKLTAGALTVDKAAALMAEHQVRRLPVVDRDKRLVGIVSLGDFAVDAGALKPAAKALSEISQPA